MGHWANLIANSTAHATPEQLACGDGNYDAMYWSVTLLLSALAILLVALRFALRHLKKVMVGLDDVLVVAGLLTALGCSFAMCVGTRTWGIGRHIWMLEPEQLIRFAMFNVYGHPVAWASTGLSKLSVLVLYWRLFATEKRFRKATLALAVLIVLIVVIYTSANLLNCSPLSYRWTDDETAEGYCWNVEPVFQSTNALWIATDLAIVLLPLPVVWKLQMPRLQCVGVIGLFLLGLLATLSCAVRWSQQRWVDAEDYTYASGPAFIWIIVKVLVANICASLITAKPWLVRLYPERMVTRIRSHLFGNSDSWRSAAPVGSPPAVVTIGHIPKVKAPTVSAVLLGTFSTDLESQLTLSTLSTGKGDA